MANPSVRILVKKEQARLMKDIKLAVSNIAWYYKSIDSFLQLVSSFKCSGVELATSMIWDEPVEASSRERLELRKKIENIGIELVGIQSLLYTRRDLLLFKDTKTRDKTFDYLIRLMDLCSDLGSKVLVFGSPSNRNISDMPVDRAYAIAVDFFGKISKEAKMRNLFFCIEPLGKNETDFINTVAEAEKLIEDVETPGGLGLIIDTKSLIEADEVLSPYLVRSFSRAKHVHLNDPGLMPPGSTGYDHKQIQGKMQDSGYSRFVSVEMRRQDPDTEGAIRRAVDYVRKVYLT